MVALAMVGCAGPEDRDVAITASTAAVPVPLVEPLPLDVAYRFDESIDQERVQKVPVMGSVSTTYRLQLGAATRSAFAVVLPAVFSSATEAPTVVGYDGIVTIRLLGAWALEGPGTTAAGVVYRLEFEPQASAEVTSWDVSGKSYGDVAAETVLSQAVRDALAQIVVGLPQQQVVQAWLTASSARGRRS